MEYEPSPCLTHTHTDKKVSSNKLWVRQLLLLFSKFSSLSPIRVHFWQSCNYFFLHISVRIRFLLIASKGAASQNCQCVHTAHTHHRLVTIHTAEGGGLFPLAYATVLSKEAVRGGSGQLSGTWNHKEDLQLWLHSKLATQA